MMVFMDAKAFLSNKTRLLLLKIGLKLPSLGCCSHFFVNWSRLKFICIWYSFADSFALPFQPFSLRPSTWISQQYVNNNFNYSNYLSRLHPLFSLSCIIFNFEFIFNEKQVETIFRFFYTRTFRCFNKRLFICNAGKIVETWIKWVGEN